MARSEHRITIKYCTQCKWMLRAAYFAQELLSTFGTDLDQVALRPVTGGVFTISYASVPVHDENQSDSQGQGQGEGEGQEKVIWDRKTDGGFPEVKILKARVRDILDPNRDLGHTDRAIRQAGQSQSQTSQAETEETRKTGSEQTGQAECTDCQ